VSTQPGAGAEITRAVSAEIRCRRQALGWSAQKLADECAGLGMPAITRTLISDLENGRRASIAVAELLAIAHILGVTPAALLCAASGEIEGWGFASEAVAARWVAGSPYAPEIRLAATALRATADRLERTAKRM
jgi:transcriptional regulator with XRE-family HTH domain